MAATKIYKKGGLLIVDSVDFPKKFYFERWEIDIRDGNLFIEELEAKYNKNMSIPITDVQDRSGKQIGTTESAIEDYIGNLSGIDISKSTSVNLATNDLGRDAWGRPKVINDYTLFAGLWTFDVPKKMWKHYGDSGSGYAEKTIGIDSSFVTSKKGHLIVKGTSAEDTLLSSKRHPRYQPNRGLLYSTAVILPDPTDDTKRRWGLFNNDNGVFFELVGDGTDATLNIVRRTTVEGTQSEQRVDITDKLPPGFDFSKGHVYDIQMEWRGVGNFYIFIDLTLTYTFDLLGTLTGMSVSNPALPVSWEVVGSTVDSASIIAGCVDVTSEGGYSSHKLFSSITNGDVRKTAMNVSGGTAVLAVRVPETFSYNGDVVSNTRDLVLSRLSAYAHDEYYTMVYVGRNIACTHLNALTWLDKDDSLYQYLEGGNGTVLDVAFQADLSSLENIYTTRNEIDRNTILENANKDAEKYITPGDVLVVSIRTQADSKLSGATLEFAEEV